MVNHTGVSIYHVPNDGAEWAKYLQEKLGMREYDLRCVVNDFTCHPSCHVVSTSANVFLVTPDFLDCRNWDTLHDFDKDTCIFVLTGVDNMDFVEAAREYRADYVLDWYVLEITNTEHSVRDMIVSIISIYESSDQTSQNSYTTCQNGQITWQNGENTCRDRVGSGIYENTHWDEEEDEEDDVYDTLPPTRQVNGLIDAFCKNDDVHIVLLRRGEGKVGVTITGKTMTPELSEYSIYRLPGCRATSNGTINVTLNGNPIGTCNISEQTATIKQTASISTQTDECTTDENMNDKDSEGSIYNNIANVCNHHSRTNSFGQCRSSHSRKCPSPTNDKSSIDKLRDILEAEIDPLGLLCRCLNIQNDLESLDEKMAIMMKSSMTLLGLLSVPKGHNPSEDAELSEWPTLLHFGAQHNLSKFCDSFLISPLGQSMCTRANRVGQLPHHVARENGHLELAEKLEMASRQTEHDRAYRCDSGVSGFSVDTSRFSSTTMLENVPPTPHKPATKNGYISMNGGRPVVEPIEDDIFGNMLDISGSYEDHVKVNRRESVMSDMSTSSVEDVHEYRHKDIEHMLGMSQSVTEPKKGLLNFFKRSRSKSVPVEQHHHDIIQKRKAETKVYRKDSPRSSGTSSTASIHSDNSIKEEEENGVKLRSKKKGKNGKKLSSLLKRAENRQSMRIKHAMTEQNFSVPTIPDRKLQATTSNLY